VLAAAEFAATRSGLDDQRIGDAVQSVRHGVFGDTPERSAVEALASSLDEVQWNLQDGPADDDDAETERWRVFGQARAAMAVFFAGGEDARDSALESVYEASAVADSRWSSWAARQGASPPSPP